MVFRHTVQFKRSTILTRDRSIKGTLSQSVFLPAIPPINAPGGPATRPPAHVPPAAQAICLNIPDAWTNTAKDGLSHQDRAVWHVCTN
ncbi:hypothetical protein DPMN_103092 [Dreissena polymorpha]|uniref:Uncharacterized protein n=1 Tax=Dreissena polymorpha TaxID=45954 RepID=A0A9D4HDT4_DREPO|nr:hypothetical protein DPMN_103092 [Dreissena polymorpha]